MSQKATGRSEQLVAIREMACDIIAAPEAHSLMTRERALDLIGYVWEVNRWRVGRLQAC